LPVIAQSTVSPCNHLVFLGFGLENNIVFDFSFKLKLAFHTERKTCQELITFEFLQLRYKIIGKIWPFRERGALRRQWVHINVDY
jgi:hypothetical protein